MVTYEPGFKEEAVKMAAEVGAPKTAVDLGIPVNTLYTWISRAKAHGEHAHVGSGLDYYNCDSEIRESKGSAQFIKFILPKG